MFSILITIHIIITIMLIAVVLLQQGKGADAGANFGGSNTNFSSRPPLSGAAKFTMFLSALFFINALGMSFVNKNQGSTNDVYKSVISDETEANQTSIPINDIKTNEPNTDSKNDVINQIPKEQ